MGPQLTTTVYSTKVQEKHTLLNSYFICYHTLIHTVSFSEHKTHTSVIVLVIGGENEGLKTVDGSNDTTRSTASGGEFGKACVSRDYDYRPQSYSNCALFLLLSNFFVQLPTVHIHRFNSFRETKANTMVATTTGAASSTTKDLPAKASSDHAPSSVLKRDRRPVHVKVGEFSCIVVGVVSCARSREMKLLVYFDCVVHWGRLR